MNKDNSLLLRSSYCTFLSYNEVKKDVSLSFTEGCPIHPHNKIACMLYRRHGVSP